MWRKLFIKQTEEEGGTCGQLLICERNYPRRQHCFAVTMERSLRSPVLLGCSRADVHIEDVAAEGPDAGRKEAANVV